MNKKEVSEIKKLFTAERCCIQKICGCYVNSSKEKILHTDRAFLSLPEEDENKYFEIFKNALSGKIGKTAFCFEFPSYKEDAESILLRFRDSELKDHVITDALYDKIIESYTGENSFYIILIHGVYDIPHVGNDNQKYNDSDYVYSFILCCVCPMKLSKSGLQYEPEESAIKFNSGDYMITQPEVAFLYPAFIDRQPDIHHVYYYSKKPADINELFIENVLQCNIPLTADEQKNRFNSLIEETFSKQCSLDKVLAIHSEITEYQEDHNGDSVSLDKMDMLKVLQKCGVSENQINSFSEHYDESFENKKLIVDNIISKRMTIKSDGITISSDITHLSDIEITEINGNKYFLIPAYGEVSFEGIKIKGGE